MNNSLGLLFYVKRSKMTEEGNAPVYLRITIDGKRIEVSSKRYVNPDKWNANRQKLSGSSEDIKKLNGHLKTLEHQVYDLYRDLIEKKLPVTAANLKDILLGKDKVINGKMLIPIFEEHNRQIKALLGKEYAAGTYERYQTSLRHTKEFLQWKYRVGDIDIRGIDHEFITSYDFYLRSERNCNNNSTVKYIKNFKKIILICIDNGWLDKDPFVRYKAKVKEVKRDYLNREELETM
jgi:hypothetical protein